MRQLASLRHSRPVSSPSGAVSSPVSSLNVFCDRSRLRSCRGIRAGGTHAQSKHQGAGSVCGCRATAAPRPACSPSRTGSGQRPMHTHTAGQHGLRHTVEDRGGSCAAPGSCASGWAAAWTGSSAPVRGASRWAASRRATQPPALQAGRGTGAEKHGGGLAAQRRQPGTQRLSPSGHAAVRCHLQPHAAAPASPCRPAATAAAAPLLANQQAPTCGVASKLQVSQALQLAQPQL